MNGRFQFQSIPGEDTSPISHEIQSRLSQSFKVEIEEPYSVIKEWFAQIRNPNAPVIAGYCGETLLEAAMLIEQSLQRTEDA